jgi:hypothetical protein
MLVIVLWVWIQYMGKYFLNFVKAYSKITWKIKLIKKAKINILRKYKYHIKSTNAKILTQKIKIWVQKI